ncbi:apolipoprotein N-acyltransferase [bacterium]|nr:apolipoprotein N-acyltransferase [bacterium]
MSNVAAFSYALISALFLTGSYPTFGLGFFAFVSLIPLFPVFMKCSTVRVLLWTWVSGVIFLGITLFWIHHITWGGMVGAVIVLAFFFALPFAVSRIIYEVSPRLGFIVLPFAVAGMEWIRSFGSLAFPWMILGNSQSSYPFFIQFADITSVYGVSAWIVLVNISSYLIMRKKTPRRWLLFAALFIIPIAYSMAVVLTGRSDGKKMQVALVQGNVIPEEKWEDGMELWNINLYRSMSVEAASSSPLDLIVWPETATPVYLLETPRYRRMVQSLVDSIGVPVLTGTPSIDIDTRETWNSAAFFVPDAPHAQIYHKIHLVPFGEAIPLDDYFPELRKLDFGQANWDKGKERVIFTSDVLPPFCAVICFESIFPDLIRSFVVKGVEFIVVITNDVWFGPSPSPQQHARISVFRAIEFHRPVIRCANTGISMIIDPYGRILKQTDTFTRDTLIGTIVPRTGRTFYMRFGNVFSLASFLFTMIALSGCLYIKYHSGERNP